MKISHEVPLSLLERSKHFNDYDYCLPHLLDKYQQYRNFYIEGKLQDPERFIIMDNGLFEGVTHTADDLIEKINLIKPDIFVVPDSWNDADTTYRNDFNNLYILFFNVIRSLDIVLILLHCILVFKDLGSGINSNSFVSNSYNPTLIVLCFDKFFFNISHRLFVNNK